MYIDTVLADAPASYWPCDDAAVTTLREVVAGRTATRIGTGQVAQQQVGPFKGMKVVGTYGYSFTPATALLAAAYTVECWVKFDALVNAGLSSIYAITGAADWRRFIRVGQGTASLAYADSAQNDGPSAATSFTSGTNSIATNTLYHLACTYAGTTGTWYINGQPITPSTVTNATPANVTSQNGFLMGGWANDNTSWPTFGTFAHIAQYNSALSAARILQHYKTGIREGVSY